MGQFARIERADRFIKEFEKELLVGIRESMALEEGQIYTLTGIKLDTRDWCGDEVVGFALFKANNGGELEVELPTGCLFDPEYPEMEDQATSLEPLLNLPSETIMERFGKANLL
jgi:hypothetical protein